MIQLTELTTLETIIFVVVGFLAVIGALLIAQRIIGKKKPEVSFKGLRKEIQLGYQGLLEAEAGVEKAGQTLQKLNKIFKDA